MVLQARLEICLAVQAVISVTHLVECQSTPTKRTENLIRVTSVFFIKNSFSFLLMCKF